MRLKQECDTFAGTIECAGSDNDYYEHHEESDYVRNTHRPYYDPSLGLLRITSL